MPDSGAYQLQTVDDVRLCEIVSESERLERTKIATRLYGGNYLMQTVGNPTRIKSLRIRAWSRAEQAAVNAAEAANTLIKAKLGAETATGYLMDAPDWSIIANAGIFEASVKFVVSSQ